MSNLFDLSGRTAVVTGGSRGIGLMIAQGLLEAGASVVISSRKAEACQSARAQLAEFGEVTAIPADLSQEDECHRLADAVRVRHDEVHILVNNAGATWGAPIEDFPATGWDKVLDLNLKSPFFLTQAFLPDLSKTATTQSPSRIINIGSVDGLSVPSLPNYSYAASKAGLHHLTRVLAVELGPRSITCNTIAPGPFATKMMATTLEERSDEFIAQAPLGRLGEPDDIAGTVVYLSSRAAGYVTGALLTVDGGLTLNR